jgi:hypothetical protein
VIKGSLPYDYKVGIGASKKDGPLEFTMETNGKNAQIKASKLFLPIQLLPLVRDRMAKLLLEFDGTQQIGPIQSSLPKWMEENGLYFFYLILRKFFKNIVINII